MSRKRSTECRALSDATLRLWVAEARRPDATRERMMAGLDAALELAHRRGRYLDLDNPSSKYADALRMLLSLTAEMRSAAGRLIAELPDGSVIHVRLTAGMLRAYERGLKMVILPLLKKADP